jgi:hypothetical protein
MTVPKPGGAIALDRIVDGHLIVARLLVILAELFGVFLHLPFIQRRLGLLFTSFSRRVLLTLFVALKRTAQHAKLGRDLEDEVVPSFRDVARV